MVSQEFYTGLPDSSIVKALLNHSMCLAATTSSRARVHITRCRKEFVEDLLQAILTSLNYGVVKDRLVLVQVYASISLFTQFLGDHHSSAEFCSRAVCHAQTIGLHLETAHHKDNDLLERIFCCVWALDRLNAAFLGRPVQIHERDLGRDLLQTIKHQNPCFRLFLHTILLLDKVIDSYRPKAHGTELSWTNNFPSFEDTVVSAGAQLVQTNLMGKRKVSFPISCDMA